MHRHEATLAHTHKLPRTWYGVPVQEAVEEHGDPVTTGPLRQPRHFPYVNFVWFWWGRWIGMQAAALNVPNTDLAWKNPVHHEVWSAEEVTSVKVTHVEPVTMGDKVHVVLVTRGNLLPAACKVCALPCFSVFRFWSPWVAVVILQRVLFVADSRCRTPCQSLRAGASTPSLDIPTTSPWAPRFGCGG